MKSPRQVRSDIRTLTAHIGQVRDALLKKADDVTVAQIGKECRRTADVLSDLLKSQQLPENYKVAVVGRFKTGKSSFVNELLGARLASVQTNPETAAITTFRHGPRVKASVRFISREEWDRLNTLYAEDPKHIDAHRMKMWASFGKPRKSKDGEIEESFDLPGLERQYVKPSGYSIEIELADDGTRKAESEFARRLKEFTTGGKPHHCLVEAIDIESPAPILDEGVLLIDTPGLDDTERFRVSLTEKTVEDVDAILFLTKSGASYGQSDKDFLLSLLRKGTVKQLIVVITQLDAAYGSHLDDAEASDEDPNSLDLYIEIERRRLAKELASTLAELGQDDSPALRRYREQLGEVEIAFTSAKLHRDWKAKKATPFAIDPDDPGGVCGLEAQLLRMLSTESRIAMTAQRIAEDSRAALLDLQSVLDTKLLAIRDIKDREVAEQKLRSFRDQFGQAGERFEGDVAKQVTRLGERLQSRRKQHAPLIETVTLLAERELAAFETNDVGRHWRTRRSGYWGYMFDLQTRVANRIFPKVQEMLGEYTEAFADFARGFEAYLDTLSKEGARISESLELGATLPFDVTGKLHDSLARTLQRAQELIATEEQTVASLLDDFVTDEVSDRIDEARRKVSDIWGTGTTKSQSAQVQAFYREVKQLLAEALVTHLQERAQGFCDFLIGEAEAAPRDALEEVQVLLEQADDNIRAAAAALVAGQKQATESLVANIKSEHQEVLVRAERLLEAANQEPAPSSKLGDLPEGLPPRPSEIPVHAPEPIERPALVAGAQPAAMPLPHPAVSVDRAPIAPVFGDGEGDSAGDGDWADQVQSDATVTIARLRMRNGERGWSYARVFPAACLKGAVRVRLIDGYLSNPHQLRNLGELLLHLAESAGPKEVEVVTKYSDAESTARQDRAIGELGAELYRSYGVTLSLRRETDVHDRYLILDHGVLFKLGRGLDFYKPVSGLGRHRPDVREVRDTEVDVFCRLGHPLAAKSDLAAA